MKKRVLTDFKKLAKEVIQAINEKYPSGFEKDITKIKTPAGEYKALLFDYEDIVYMIKIENNTTSAPSSKSSKIKFDPELDDLGIDDNDDEDGVDSDSGDWSDDDYI